MEIIEFNASEIRKIMETIKMKLINSGKRRIRFHHSYPRYPNKMNMYESFSNIIDAHIKLPRVDPSLSRPKNIYRILIPHI